MNRDESCRVCGTSLSEILDSGFVGCENCYKLDGVKKLLKKLYPTFKNKGLS